MRAVTEGKNTLAGFVLGAFFFVFKTLTAVLLALALALAVSQSAVAPVSTRLLGVYAVEYAAKAVKPCRHLFPRPYMVNLEEQTQR